VTIGLSSSDTTEGTVGPSSLTFTPANWSTPQIVTVTGVGDALSDGNIAYTIVTAAATSADSSYSGRNASDVSVTNQDNAAGILVTPTSGLTTSEAGSTANFTVVLTQQPTANVTIPLSSSNLSEGTVAPSSLTFTPANWNVPQTVTATGVNDSVDDGDVGYTIITAAATSADPSYTGRDAADVVITSQDDDTAGITVTPTSGLTTTEAGGTATFTVRLDSEPTANVTVGLSSNDTTEGLVSPASLVFTPANWNTPQTVTVTGVADAIDDGNVSYTIVTAAATSADTVYSGRSAADVAVTNQDDDTAGITVTPIGGLTTTEAGGTATFSVRLNSEPTGNVSIGLNSSDTTEGTVAPVSLTFTSANWNVPQTVTVTGVNDTLADGNVAYTIVTAAATSTDPSYQGRDADNVALTNTDDEQISLSIVRDAHANEAGPANGQFTVSQSAVTTSETRVTYSIGGTATAGTDYAPLTGTAIIPAGELSVPIALLVQDDNQIEGLETAILTLTTIAAGDPRLTIDTAANAATAEIADDETGLVSIALTTGGNETGPISVVFTITQDGTAANDTVVNLAFSGAAAAGSDYTAPPATITIPAGQTSATVTIPVINDTVVETNETLIVTLALGAHSPLVALDPALSSATGTILDNDSAQVSVAAAANGNEAGPISGRFTVTQSAPSAVDTTISYTISGSAASGSDFPPLSGSVVIPAGQTSADVIISFLNDAVVEPTETVSITLSSITGAALVTINPAQNVASLDVADNDTALISIAAQSGGSEEGPAAASFLVTLSAASSTPTTISYQVAGSATPGDDFTTLAGSVTIPAGSTSAVIDVSVLDDQRLEGVEAVSVTLSSITTGDPQISLDAQASAASLQIADNESGLISIAATASGNEAGPASGQFTVTQGGITTANTVVSYQVTGTATSAGGDFQPLSGSVTIPAGSTSAVIDVNVLDDLLVEGTENVQVTLTTITSGDASLAINNSADEATLDIADNDAAQLSIQQTTHASEAGASAGSFTLLLDRAAAVDVVVNYSVSGTAASGDIVPLPGSVTIPAGQTSATIVVTPVDDALVEATESVLITLAGVNPGPPAVVISSTAGAASLDIADNDVAQASIATTTAASETGPVAGVFTVTLTAASSTATTIAYSVSGTAASGSDFTALTGTVAIPAGATSATISVPTVDDVAVEGNETVILTLTSITSGDEQITLSSTAAATLEIADNDSATIAFAAASSTAIESTGSHQVLVRLTLPAGGQLARPVAVNVANPAGGTASPGDFNLATTTVTFPAGSQDGATQAVTLALTSDGVTEPDETLNLALTIGTDPTGRVTVVAPGQHVVTISDDPITASLSGSVWADTNGNGQRDAGEMAIPGVTVRLTGTSTGGQQVSRTATTDHQGAYQFTNLPGGTYSITQQQPVAMIDGSESLGTVNGVSAGTIGSDQFTNIVLPAAGSGAGFNFGELSLHPRYINARLFTVSALARASMFGSIVIQAEQAAAAAPPAAASTFAASDDPPEITSATPPPAAPQPDAEGEDAPAAALTLSRALDAAQQHFQACGGVAGPSIAPRLARAISAVPTYGPQRPADPPATAILCDAQAQHAIDQILEDEDWIHWLADRSDPLD
jgi:hypothetical protein